MKKRGKKQQVLDEEEDEVNAEEAVAPQQSAPLSRRETQRNVAHSRASHFARFAPSSSSSSVSSSTTPTGVQFENNAVSHWPGPWSSAMALVEQRDDARAKRMAAIAEREGGGGAAAAHVEGTISEEHDRYESAWFALVAKNNNNASRDNNVDDETRTAAIVSTTANSTVPTLQGQCIASLVQNFFNPMAADKIRQQQQQQVPFSSSIDDKALDALARGIAQLPPALCDDISAALARRRILHGSCALLLAVPGSESLMLPDSSLIDEEELIQIVERVCGGSEQQPEEDDNDLDYDDGDRNENRVAYAPKDSNYLDDTNEWEDKEEEHLVNQLRSLQLRHCGRGFTQRMVAATSKYLHQLEVVQITGCYRLTSDGLSLLVQSTGSSLRSLDITCCSTLSGAGLAAVAEYAPILERLVLDNSQQLRDEDLVQLLPPTDDDETSNSNTRSSASASGSTICNARSVLPHLSSLSLAGLVDITDSAFLRIVQYFGKTLQHLSIRGCSQLTSTSLLAIRQYCDAWTLHSLDVSQLGRGVNTVGLLSLFVTEDCTSGAVACAADNGHMESIISSSQQRASESVKEPSQRNVKGRNKRPLECDDNDIDAVKRENFNSKNKNSNNNNNNSSSSSSSASDVPLHSRDTGLCRLESFVATGNSESMTDDVIVALCECSTSLGSIGGSSSSSSSSSSSNTGSSSSLLRNISLGSNNQLSVRSLMALAQHCKSSLVSIDISFVRKPPELAVRHVVRSCPLLAQLNVFGCTQLTESFVNEIAESGLYSTKNIADCC